MHIVKLLEEKGLQLPQPIRLPAGMRLPFQRVRVRGNRAYVSGHGPLLPEGTPAGPYDKVGGEVSEEEAYRSATDGALDPGQPPAGTG